MSKEFELNCFSEKAYVLDVGRPFGRAVFCSENDALLSFRGE